MAYTTIDDGSKYFTTLLYTGNATDDRNLTNDANAGDFKPDWLWLKERSSTSSHQLVDSTRGSSLAVMSDSNAAEDEDANRVQAFQTNGFQIGTASTVNQDTITMVAWQWKANGGTTASNTDGSITSTVQANTDAGFSIVTYTGTGSAATVGHGLGGTPDFITTKSRNVGSRGWTTWTNALAGNQALDLNDIVAAYTSTTSWNSTTPTSTVFSVGTRVGTNENNTTYVAYCFKSIQGYSKIGKYIGNGVSNNGTFAYTGFLPSWVMIKNTSSAASWLMFDNKRGAGSKRLYANDQQGEDTNTADGMDFVSNGFKIRSSTGGSAASNASGSTFIYMAFAESPFVSSEGVPTTAR